MQKYQLPLSFSDLWLSAWRCVELQGSAFRELLQSCTLAAAFISSSAFLVWVLSPIF